MKTPDPKDNRNICDSKKKRQNILTCLLACLRAVFFTYNPVISDVKTPSSMEHQKSLTQQIKTKPVYLLACLLAYLLIIQEIVMRDDGSEGQPNYL